MGTLGLFQDDLRPKVIKRTTLAFRLELHPLLVFSCPSQRRIETLPSRTPEPTHAHFEELGRPSLERSNLYHDHAPADTHSGSATSHSFWLRLLATSQTTHQTLRNQKANVLYLLIPSLNKLGTIFATARILKLTGALVRCRHVSMIDWRLFDTAPTTSTFFLY